MLGERRTSCPNCGGPIEVQLAASAVIVCPHCRYSIVRKGKALSAVGKVADLVPTAPPFGVGDAGTIGGDGFRVIGRLQLDHGAGPWDEWYVAFGDDSWGWLARAQGRWYLTRPAEPTGDLPPWTDAAAGSLVHLGSDQPWRVGNRGKSTVVSAEGELPFAVEVGEKSRYVDLHGPAGGFATIDYGAEPKAERKLFLGREIEAAAISMSSAGEGPRPVEKVATRKFSCPSCGAPIEIVSPDAERVACQYCFTLLDYENEALRVVEKLAQLERLPLLPIGTRGELRGESSTVIAYLERFTVVDGVRYDWREYLLYGPRGYRWLLEDSGHWTLLEAISPGEVTIYGGQARYRDADYRPFSRNAATVSLVLGELYWKVRAGERVVAADFVAPPKILSMEQSDDEVVWSAGEYVEAAELRKAFGLEAAPPWPRWGVAPAQPNPHDVGSMVVLCAILVAALVAVTFVVDWTAPSRTILAVPLRMPAEQGSAVSLEEHATYSEPFTIEDGPTVLDVQLSTTADNDYVGVALALVDEGTGAVREAVVETELYTGYTGGESWSEGSSNASISIDRVPAGRYTLRMEPEWRHWGGTYGSSVALRTPSATITVAENRGSAWCFLLTLLFLAAPVGLRIALRATFEKQRWENSNL